MDTAKIREMYFDIQKRIFYMIPEKWEKIYLYASVIENINFIETGEMYIYYIPKGILRKKPVNIYEVPAKFNIDEQEYIDCAEKLYEKIKELREELRKNKEKVWSSVVISITDSKFNAEYHYENLINSNYNNYDRHIIFKYKYLNAPLESFNKKEQKMIEQYLIDEKLKNDDGYLYTQNLYIGEIHNCIEFGQYKKEKNIYEEEEKFKETKHKENDKEQEISSKNQILNI